jgi:hypothetical protein
METLREILTGIHLGSIFALLQVTLYVFILFAVAVLSWWLAIVLSDLKKRFTKTGVRK